MKKQLAQISDKKLEQLAKDPRNIVYKYGDRDPLPKEEIIPCSEVRSKVERLYQRYKDERQAFLDKRLVLNEKRYKYIKRKILQDPEWKRFDYTHPLIFDRVIDPKTTDQEIQSIYFMIDLKENGGNAETLRKHIMDTYAKPVDSK